MSEAHHFTWSVYASGDFERLVWSVNLHEVRSSLQFGKAETRKDAIRQAARKLRKLADECEAMIDE